MPDQGPYNLRRLMKQLGRMNPAQALVAGMAAAVGIDVSADMACKGLVIAHSHGKNQLVLARLTAITETHPGEPASTMPPAVYLEYRLLSAVMQPGFAKCEKHARAEFALGADSTPFNVAWAKVCSLLGVGQSNDPAPDTDPTPPTA